MAKQVRPKSLGARDLIHEVGDDAAYLAIVDVERYAKDLPDWNYDSLTKKIIKDMSDGRIVAWGCPDGPVRVRLTTRARSSTMTAKTNAKHMATLVTRGKLCLVGYTSLTMCAQFGDQAFPQHGDLLFSLTPGTYAVTVHRLFAHRAGEQFPEEDDLPAGDHYVVSLVPARAAKRMKHRTVPWAPSLD
jgi:hypothetical protein